MKVTKRQLRRIIKEEKRKLIREGTRGPSAMELTDSIRNIIMELEEITDIPSEPGGLEEEVIDFAGDAIVILKRALSTLAVM